MLYWGDIVSWLEPVVGYQEKAMPLPEPVILSLSIGVVLIGAVIAILMYQRRPVPIEAPHGSWLTRAAREELYGNQVNDVLVVEPSLQLATATTWFDTKAVDGFVGWLASFTGALSGQLRRYQSGFARSYALSMVGGAVLVVLALILVRLS